MSLKEAYIRNSARSTYFDDECIDDTDVLDVPVLLKSLPELGAALLHGLRDVVVHH